MVYNIGMELRIFNSLRELNRRFYDVHARSFSETRHTIWPGWLRVSDAIERQGIDQIRMLDVAAGNGRFESFMAERFPSINWEVTCVDPCKDLMRMAQGKLAAVGFGNMSCKVQAVDVLEVLEASVSHGREKIDAPDAEAVDRSASNCQRVLVAGSGQLIDEEFEVVVCFGFMHHVYGQEMRENLLKLLISQTKPGGLIALSFWRFATDEGFKHKAERETEQAFLSDEVQRCLGDSAAEFRGPGDYLLGWQGSTEYPRYCHSYSSEEITRLIASVSDHAKLIDRYCADGRSCAMNEYVILQAL